MTITSKEFKTDDKKVTIYGIQTGKLAIKHSSLHTSKPGTFSTLTSFRDRKFGEWLPVWCWLIKHPEGLFLIDLGLSSDVTQPNYFKKIDFVSRYYFTKQMIYEIEEADEVQNQLLSIGITPQSIDKILLTHLHIDHVGGLSHFPDTPIIVNQKEWKTMDGSFPKLFPTNVNFRKVELSDNFKHFKRAHYITKSKDLILVETPGHTRGHCSVILKVSDQKIIFFGGDVAYNEFRLKNQMFSSTIKSHSENIKSCHQVMKLGLDAPTIFLPSHDTKNHERLFNELYLTK